MIGTKITHNRYGLAKVTHIWRKLINPQTRQTKLYALTFELLTEKGKALHNNDRNISPFTDGMNVSVLPRCFEDNLNRIEVVK